MHQVLMTTLSVPHHQWYLMKMENTLYLHPECTDLLPKSVNFKYYKKASHVKWEAFFGHLLKGKLPSFDGKFKPNNL